MEVPWAAMHLTTVHYAQFAGNNLVHNADQIMNSHVEEFICSRSVFKAWRRVGTTNDWVPVDRSGGCIRILGTLTKQPLPKEDDWLTLSLEKLGIEPHRSILPASAIYGLTGRIRREC